MRIELGLKYHKTEYKTNDISLGLMGVTTPKSVILKCRVQGFLDIRRHQDKAC